MNKHTWASKNTREYYQEQEKYREKMSSTKHFWYSEKQAEVYKLQNDLGGWNINKVFVNNEWKIFTVQSVGDNHKCRWNDMKLIATGDLPVQYGPEKW